MRAERERVVRATGVRDGVHPLEACRGNRVSVGSNAVRHGLHGAPVTVSISTVVVLLSGLFNSNGDRGDRVTSVTPPCIVTFFSGTSVTLHSGAA